MNISCHYFIELGSWWSLFSNKVWIVVELRNGSKRICVSRYLYLKKKNLEGEFMIKKFEGNTKRKVTYGKHFGTFFLFKPIFLATYFSRYFFRFCKHRFDLFNSEFGSNVTNLENLSLVFFLLRIGYSVNFMGASQMNLLSNQLSFIWHNLQKM